MTDYANMSQSDCRAEDEEPERCDCCNRIVEPGQSACECGATWTRTFGWSYLCRVCQEPTDDKGPCDVCAPDGEGK